MSQASSLVDRAARRALRETTVKTPDLLRDGFPFEPGLWNIVLEPLQPRTLSDGGIEVVDQSREAEEHQITIGRILKVGPAAMDGKTTSGIDLSNFLPGINTAKQLIGLYAIHMGHVGQVLRLRKTDQTIRVMKVTDLLGVTNDPHAWKFYI
jgi:hypothetical protein